MRAGWPAIASAKAGITCRHGSRVKVVGRSGHPGGGDEADVLIQGVRIASCPGRGETVSGSAGYSHLARQHTQHSIGELAQLGERLVCNQEVTGSSPVFSTMFFAPQERGPARARRCELVIGDHVRAR